MKTIGTTTSGSDGAEEEADMDHGDDEGVNNSEAKIVSIMARSWLDGIDGDGGHDGPGQVNRP